MRTCKESEAASEGFLKTKVAQADWSAILADAVSKPGVISGAYRRFWNYSVGNQLLALFQCLTRKVDPGPLNTFIGWKDLGRNVKKGEKAITLCMPVTLRRKSTLDPIGDRAGDKTEGDGEANEDDETFTRFVYRANWFVLSQTEGQAYLPTEVPDWSEERTLSLLKITRVAFRHLDGNAQGYTRAREIAVSPIPFLSHRTVFHELAHVVLGHTEEDEMQDGEERTPRDLREVEAECVALICCESLNLPGAEFSRGYIQHWLGKERQEIPQRSAQKVFRAADQIMKAGYPTALED